MGMLAAGINSPALVYFAVAWVSQLFLRTRRPKWFAKYNYILGAGVYPPSLYLIPYAARLR